MDYGTQATIARSLVIRLGAIGNSQLRNAMPWQRNGMVPVHYDNIMLRTPVSIGCPRGPIHPSSIDRDRASI